MLCCGVLVCEVILSVRSSEGVYGVVLPLKREDIEKKKKDLSITKESREKQLKFQIFLKIF